MPVTELSMFKPSSEFARASDDAKSALIATSSRRAYANNEVIYLQEESAQNLYFVVSGHVRLSYVLDDGSAILYAILPAGDSPGASEAGVGAFPAADTSAKAGSTSGRIPPGLPYAPTSPLRA